MSADTETGTMCAMTGTTDADVDKYHALYCAKLLELFDNYKKHNPDYARKSLEVE